MKVDFGRIIRALDVIMRTGIQLIVICEKNIRSVVKISDEAWSCIEGVLGSSEFEPPL